MIKIISSIIENRLIEVVKSFKQKFLKKIQY